jgi:hypothetical protein
MKKRKIKKIVIKNIFFIFKLNLHLYIEFKEK